MSGHSKWSTIKRQKATSDAKRGNLFTKLANAIALAARDGGDPSMNSKLRMTIDKAKSLNMPNANIDRAVKRGTGELGGEQLEEVVYEGFGPGNTALLVSTITDNKNRTVANVRKALTSHGGSLGGENSVKWMFETKGVVTVQGKDEETELALIEAGAEDTVQGDEGISGIFPPFQIDTIKEKLASKHITILEAEDRPVANMSLDLAGDDAGKLTKLIDTLEEDDDVTSVNTNARP